MSPKALDHLLDDVAACTRYARVVSEDERPIQETQPYGVDKHICRSR